jgi:hypothetical protein
MGLIYADLTSPADIDTLVANVVTAMLAKGKGPKFLHGPEKAVVNAIFRHEANRVARSERSTPTAPLSEAGQSGLRDYLQGPVLNQLRQEWGEVPENLCFVYGHTHKPFLARQALAGFPGAVDIVNTGGWVVDTSGPNLYQAGVAVLVNDDLDTASLQFYRQTPGSAPSPVRLLDPPEGVTPSAWQAELASRIDPAAEPWSSLAKSAADLVAQRHRLQERPSRFATPHGRPAAAGDLIPRSSLQTTAAWSRTRLEPPRVRTLAHRSHDYRPAGIAGDGVTSPGGHQGFAGVPGLRRQT